jgi:hypothetical protein
MNSHHTNLQPCGMNIFIAISCLINWCSQYHWSSLYQLICSLVYLIGIFDVKFVYPCIYTFTPYHLPQTKILTVPSHWSAPNNFGYFSALSFRLSGLSELYPWLFSSLLYFCHHLWLHVTQSLLSFMYSFFEF